MGNIIKQDDPAYQAMCGLAESVVQIEFERAAKGGLLAPVVQFDRERLASIAVGAMMAWEQSRAAFQAKDKVSAAELLVRAYANAHAAGGSVEWEQLDSAWEVAKKELGDLQVGMIEQIAEKGAGDEGAG